MEQQPSRPALHRSVLQHPGQQELRHRLPALQGRSLVFIFLTFLQEKVAKGDVHCTPPFAIYSLYAIAYIIGKTRGIYRELALFLQAYSTIYRIRYIELHILSLLYDEDNNSSLIPLLIPLFPQIHYLCSKRIHQWI